MAITMENHAVNWVGENHIKENLNTFEIRTQSHLIYTWTPEQNT